MHRMEEGIHTAHMTAEPAHRGFDTGENAAGSGISSAALDAGVARFRRVLIVEIQPVRLHKGESDRSVRAIDFKAEIVVGSGKDLAALNGAGGAVFQAGGHIKRLLGIGMPCLTIRTGADRIHNPANAEHRIKRAAEIIDQIYDMRAQIKQNTAAADVPILLPSRGLGGIRRTAVIVCPAEADDPPQAAAVDQGIGC